MTIICRSCNHVFRRAHIVRPRTLRPWDCPLKRCNGYGTIASIAETFHIASGVYPANGQIARLQRERRATLSETLLGKRGARSMATRRAANLATKNERR